MSTIASPREPSVNGRRPGGGPLVPTPTSSSRPSIENPRSSDPSPSRASLSSSHPPLPKRNRNALREYYNLKSSAAAAAASNADDAASVASSVHDNNALSEVVESELDSPGFDAQAYTKHVLENQDLGELLRTYNGVLTDIRALDAEKKALVYDNYSKLITATETIRKMRDNMDPLNPMAGTLDLAVRGVYERADALREELRRELGEKGNGGEALSVEEIKRREKRRKARVVVERVLETPQRIRKLVEDGKEEEARTLWDPTLVLLEKWKTRGVGGGDVQDCIDDGEAALRGEPPSEKSWTKPEQGVKS